MNAVHTFCAMHANCPLRRDEVPRSRCAQQGCERSRMSRVVLVSNRVLDLRKAAQAGGVAVALADIVRTRPRSGSAGTARSRRPMHADVRHRDGRIATVPLSQADHDGYYLGYANSVLWPVFHNRLDLAQFEAGYFEQYVDVNRRLAGLLQPMLRARRRHLGARLSPDPVRRRAAQARRRRTRSASTCTSRSRPGRRSWRSPSIRSSRARWRPMI